MNYDSIHHMIDGMVKTNTCPNMLFYGPPGCGKSTTASSLGTMLYPKDRVLRVMNINASDERGMGVIREKITAFIRTNTLSSHIQTHTDLHHVGGTPSTNPIPMKAKKMVILDEVDYMIPDAQIGISELMDDNRDILFLFICNYHQRIQPQVLSRVVSVRFSTPSVVHLERIICKQMDDDHVSYSKNTVPAMCKLGGYDIRKVSYMADVLSTINTGSINVSHVYKYNQYPSDKSISAILRRVKSGEYTQNDTSRQLFNMMDCNGVRVENIIESLYTIVKHTKEFSVPIDKWFGLVSELAHIETTLTYDPFPYMITSHLAACMYIALL